MNYKNDFDQGITYKEYLSNFEIEVNKDVKCINSKNLLNNWQHTNYIDKNLVLSPEINFLKNEIKWLVVFNYSCNKSSEILPVINKIAVASRGKIELKIIHSNQNHKLSSKCLTVSSKFTPKIIQLDTNFNLIKEWTPRSVDLKKLTVRLKPKLSDPPVKLNKPYDKKEKLYLQTVLYSLLNL